MDDSLRVRRSQRVRDLHPDLEDVLKPKRPALNSRLQSLAIEIFHDNERPAVVFADVVDRTNLRMIERRRGARLDPESFDRLLVSRPFLREKLLGDWPAQPHVLGLVDDAHSSGAQLLEDFVMRNRVSNHGRMVANAYPRHNSNRFAPSQPSPSRCNPS